MQHGPGTIPTKLLSAATVILTVRNGTGETSLGTGFLITPTIQATCAHVVADVFDEPRAEVSGRIAASNRELRLIPLQHRCFRDKSTGMDLALLDVISQRPEPPLEPVLLCAEGDVGDLMWTFGHPAWDFRGGESATFTFEGYGFLSQDPGQRVMLP
ncbi:S1 family peptidase, partial [Streptomyces sp. NPDC005070]